MQNHNRLMAASSGNPTVYYELNTAKSSKKLLIELDEKYDSVTSSNVLRKGSLQTKLNTGLSEQQQEDLFQSERSFHEVKLLTTRT